MPGLNGVLAENAPVALALGGVAIGMAFGAVTHRTNFCTLGALSDIVALNDYRRLRAWVLAVAVAVLGTQGLQAAGIVDLTRSMYLAPTLNWFGHVAGGAMFGVGMALAGGCASRNLTRAGSGDLRALTTLIVLGIFAYMTIGGVIGPVRAGVERATAVDLAARAAPTQSLRDIAAATLGTQAATSGPMLAAALAATLLAWCFLSGNFRSSPRHIVSGLGVGLCVIAGWALTGLAADDFAAQPIRPASLTFVRPTGDTLDWLQRFTALGLPGFGAATVLGTMLGAGASAAVRGHFRVVAFTDRGDML
ncbi:MAG: YeeE/YedE family protein, partial [Hyphomicrobiaceae bacterium]